MNKETSKTESHYYFQINSNESLSVIQEENVIDRDAIKIDFYKEMWRTPEEMAELLQKIVIVISKNFIENKK